MSTPSKPKEDAREEATETDIQTISDTPPTETTLADVLARGSFRPDQLREILRYLQDEKEVDFAAIKGLTNSEFTIVMNGIFPEGRRNKVRDLLAPFRVAANPHPSMINPAAANTSTGSGAESDLQTGLTGPKEKFFSIAGIDPSTNFCCIREHALYKITETFAEHQIWRGGSILVQAAPTSGKTGFMSLFQSKMMQYNTVSITMHEADDLPSFMSGLKLRFNKQQLCKQVSEQDYIWGIIENRTLWKDPTKPLVLLIDEGQLLFTGKPGAAFLANLKARQNPGTIYATIVFSMYDINTVNAALERGGDPGSIGDWVARYYFSDVLQWSWKDTEEYFDDYHKNNQSGRIVNSDIQKIIFEKCDGHGGYISTILFGITRYCHSNSIQVFNLSEWLLYLHSNFTSDMNQIRSSVAIADLLHVEKMRGAITICEQLVLLSTMKLDHLNDDVRWLIKLGIIQSIGKSMFAFTSSVMRVVLLRCLVTQNLTNVPTRVLYKDPLAFLMACLPLIKQNSVNKCLSLTQIDGRPTQKEDVWVCQIFAAAQSILPVGCIVEPQFTSTDTEKKKWANKEKKLNHKEENQPPKKEEKEKNNHGEVDIMVHNGSSYLLEFLITEADTNTAKSYIQNHLEQFTAAGKYQHHLYLPAAVVNITHIPDPKEVDMPEGCSAQLFHFIVAPGYTEAKLKWTENGVDHVVPIQFGSSMYYNKETKVSGSLDTTKL